MVVEKILLIIALFLVFAAPILFCYLHLYLAKKKKAGYTRIFFTPIVLILEIAAIVLIFFLKRIQNAILALPFLINIVDFINHYSSALFNANIAIIFLENAVFAIIFLFVTNALMKVMKELFVFDTTPYFLTKDKSKYNFFRKMEINVLDFFKKSEDIKYVFKWMAIISSIVFGTSYFLALTCILFNFNIPYFREFMDGMLMYPYLLVFLLWELYFALSGLCDWQFDLSRRNIKTTSADLSDSLKKISEETKKYYAEEYNGGDSIDLESLKTNEADLNENYGFNNITKAIGGMVKASRGEYDKTCLSAINQLIESDRNLLLTGSFYSEFAEYFFRYLNVILSSNKKVIFVCTNELEIDEISKFLEDGFSSILSLRMDDNKNSELKNPLWKIEKISGLRFSSSKYVESGQLEEKQVLVSTIHYICSNEFKREYQNFIDQTEMVVIPNTLEIVINNSIQFSTIFYRLSQNHNRKIKYVLFDDLGIPELDRRVRNLAKCEFEMINLSLFSPKVIVDCYNLEEHGHKQIVESEQNIGMISNMALIGSKYKINNISVFARKDNPFESWIETVYSNKNKIDNLIDSKNLNKIHFHGHKNESSYIFDDNYEYLIAYDSYQNLPLLLKKYIGTIDECESLISVLSNSYMLRDYFADNIKNIYQKKDYYALTQSEEDVVISAFRLLAESANSDGIDEEKVIEAYNVDENLRREINKRNSKGIPNCNAFELKKILSSVPSNEKAVYAQIKLIPSNLSNEGYKNYVSNDSEISKYLNFHFRNRIDKNIDSITIMLTALELCGISTEGDFYSKFRFETTNSFDINGNYTGVHNRIIMRNTTEFCSILEGKGLVRINDGINVEVLPLTKDRIYQNYIEGQNLVFRGTVYHISSIDEVNGIVYVENDLDGRNTHSFKYIQDRTYYVDLQRENLSKIKKYQMNINSASITKIEFDHFKMPSQVLTKGYYEKGHHSLSYNETNSKYHNLLIEENNYRIAKKCYRKYNSLDSVANEVCDLIGVPFYMDGMNTIAVKIYGDFGETKDKITYLLSVMLNELFPSVFPYSYDSIVALPILDNPSLLDSEDARRTKVVQPEVVLISPVEKDDCIEVLICEDSKNSIGVIASLLNQPHPLENLFNAFHDYLTWRSNSNNLEKAQKYLRYGADHELDCFDFEGLMEKIISVLASRESAEYLPTEEVVEQDVLDSKCCFCCDRHIQMSDVSEISTPDRVICKSCADKLVGKDSAKQKAIEKEAREYVEKRFGIKFNKNPKISYEPSKKIKKHMVSNNIAKGISPVLNYYESKKNIIHVEHEVPEINLVKETIGLLLEAWVMVSNKDQNVLSSELENKISKGYSVFAQLDYLNSLSVDAANNIKDELTKIVNSSNDDYGEGYRLLLDKASTLDKNVLELELIDFVYDTSSYESEDTSIIENEE